MVSDPTLTPELLLEIYAAGYFPMAESRHDEALYWFSPEERGILPLESFHVPRSLMKFLKHSPFEIRFSTAFPEVIRACAEIPRHHESGTWINDTIIALYSELWRQGHAHSVECWQEGELVGGLYGVAIGSAFFGESMFSRKVNASKTALCHLVHRLKHLGYHLLDTQYSNPHLLQFGCVEIPQKEYLQRLVSALRIEPAGSFGEQDAIPPGNQARLL
jgi:leucyl/phenylalanyl-tRNA--protein transferase